ncbi:MAG: peptide ABC transporter permease, partial [Bdellovibrionota bacterium]
MKISGRSSPWRRFVRHRPAVVGGGFLLLLGLIALFAPWFTPVSYEIQNIA